MFKPEQLKYTKDHEWIFIDGNIGIIGVTDYAQGELGDIVYIDIDPKLSEISLGETFGTIEAVKTVSDLYAPCSGKVIELNKELTDHPELVNAEPLGEGWMIKIEIADPSQLNELLDLDAYNSLIGK
jgi:glycine cleavage system H protein